jgi:uncharacterized membrane protein
MGKRRFRRDRKGAVAVVFATGSVVLLAVAGVVIDGGNVYSAKRSLQGATDLASIAAASDLPNATAAAQANAVINHYNTQDVTAVTLGTYTPNPGIPPAQRFQPGPLTTANAVQVTMTHQQPLLFADVFRYMENNPGLPGTRAIVTQSIASAQRVVSFGIGSRVAAFNGGIVNAVLGAAVGGQVSLSLIDYNALASGQVDLFALGKALSVQAGQVGGTYGQAVNQTVSTSAFIQAMETAAPALAPVLAPLQNAASLGAGTVDLTKLINFGPYAQTPVNQPEPQAVVTASALQLLQAAAGLNTTPHLINLNLNANIPGIASVTGMMTLGEPAQYSTLLTVSQVGTSVHTSQIRLFLDVALLGQVSGAAVHLPLYLEVGYGTATLGGLSCNALDNSATQATLNVTPGLVNGWIGTVTAADMVNYTSEPNPGPATLLNLIGLATVTGRANAMIGNTQPVQVAYNATDIANATIKTSSTTDFVSALLSSLLGKLQMQVTTLGLGVNVPGLTSAVSAALIPAATPVDALINQVLQSAGLDLGQADTWITGARCSAGTIVG